MSDAAAPRADTDYRADNAPQRILHMHFGKEGGAERFFVNLARAFDERGIEQRFVIRPNRSFLPALQAMGPVMQNDYRRLSLSAPFLTWRVHRMIREWQPDVIMAWMSRSSRLIPDYAPAFKVTRLGDYPRHLKHFRHNDAIITNAPGMAEACRELGWEGGLHIVSNFPREVTPVAIDRASLDTPEDAFVVAGTGRFVRRKGFDTLIRAVAAIPDAWLWLAGEGTEDANLRALVDELGMAGRTRFTGWVDEPMHIVAAADAYCMPSRHEPLGNVILESWRAGVPTVTTRSEGPSWFVEDGKDALMVDIDDTEAMTAAFLRLRDDPALGRTLVENASAKLAARFTKERIVDEYLDLFARRG